jgi:hypothetical protein
VSIVERQARQALDRNLLSSETVKGFTLCEWPNGQATAQAFASRSVNKGFFAFSDLRVFLIPIRVRDLMSVPYSQIDDMWARGVNEFLTLKLDRITTLNLIVNDPSVTARLLEFWSEYYKYATELFDLHFRTPDFDKNLLTEVDKQLSRGLSSEDAVRRVGTSVYELVMRYSEDKSVATAGAGAALKIARSHPAVVAANAARAD